MKNPQLTMCRSVTTSQFLWISSVCSIYVPATYSPDSNLAVWCWIRDRQVAGPNLTDFAVEFAHAQLPLSPSSTVWDFSGRAVMLRSYRKETVGLASHWSCVTDFVVYPGTVSQAYETEISTPLIIGPFASLPYSP